MVLSWHTRLICKAIRAFPEFNTLNARVTTSPIMIVYSMYKNFLSSFASKFVHFLLQSLFCLSGPDKYRKSKLYTTSQDPKV